MYNTYTSHNFLIIGKKKVFGVWQYIGREVESFHRVPDKYSQDQPYILSNDSFGPTQAQKVKHCLASWISFYAGGMGFLKSNFFFSILFFFLF